MDLDALAERARALVSQGRRVALGIAGMPGAGKSTFAAALVSALEGGPAPDSARQPRPPVDPDAQRGPSGWVALLPMDGFHFPPARLVTMGMRERMGAPETFDATAYAQTLERITRDDQPVTAPSFDRTVEEPVPGGIRVEVQHRLVVTEGNYLLLPDDPWPRARAQLAEVWYVRLDEPTRVRRLVARHVEFGKTAADARAWVKRSDQANARLVGSHAAAADLLVELA